MGESCSEKVILIGRSNVTRIVDSLDSQRRDGRFCDIVIKLNEDCTVAAHACVLSAFSSYVSDIMSQQVSRHSSEENPHVVELYIVPTKTIKQDTLYVNLKQVVEHFYGKNLCINKENCYNIYSLALFFRADGIIQQCEQFIASKFSDEPYEVSIKTETSEENKNVPDTSNINTDTPETFKDFENSKTLCSTRTKRKNTRKVSYEPDVKVTKKPSRISSVEKLFKGETKLQRKRGRPALKLKISRLRKQKVGRPKSKRTDNVEEIEEDSGGDNQNELKCKKCDYITTRVTELRKHSLTHYGRPYVCRSCGYRVKQPALMVKHLLDSLDCPMHQDQIICSVCDEELTSNEELHEHFKLHDQKKPFLCSICELRFPFKSALVLHKTTHVDDRTFACEICNRTFKTKYSLQNHMIVHETNKKFLCDECGYITAYKASLEAHKLIHTGNTLKCTYPGCAFQAVRTSNLNEHMLSHSKEKPHQCEVCGQAFSRAKHLRRHAFMHGGTNLPAHACPLCNFTSYRSDKVKVHIRKQHPNDTDAAVATTTLSTPPTFTHTYQQSGGQDQLPYQVVSAELLLQQALSTIATTQPNSYTGQTAYNDECESLDNIMKLSPARH